MDEKFAATSATGAGSLVREADRMGELLRFDRLNARSESARSAGHRQLYYGGPSSTVRVDTRVRRVYRQILYRPCNGVGSTTGRKYPLDHAHVTKCKSRIQRRIDRRRAAGAVLWFGSAMLNWLGYVCNDCFLFASFARQYREFTLSADDAALHPANLSGSFHRADLCEFRRRQESSGPRHLRQLLLPQRTSDRRNRSEPAAHPMPGHQRT
jgi:hypothetical protein